MLPLTEINLFLYGVLGITSTPILLDLLEGVKIMLPVKKIPKFELGDNHADIFGKTRMGKTFATMKTLDQQKCGVFFFNTLHTKIEGTTTFVTGDGDNSIDQIFDLLQAGRKINFMPSTDLTVAEKQLEHIVKGLYNYEECDIYFAVDEVHLFKKEGLNAMKRIATAGLRYGYKGVFISQRPANVHNDLITQATYQVFFHLSPQDQEYLSKLVPIEEIMQKVNGEKYVFATYDEDKVEGGFMIK